MTPEQCAAMGQMMGGMMGQMSGGMMGGGWSWGGIAWLGLVTLLVIVAVGLAIAVFVARRPSASAGEDPREILRRRFARGEVSADEFAAAMKTLG